MSSNDRRNEPIGGEPVPARPRPARPVSSTPQPSGDGDPGDENVIVGPPSRVRTARPKRPMSQRLAALIPPVTVDDTGSIATVAGAASTNGSTNGSTSPTGTAKEVTAKKGSTTGNGTAPKRSPQKAGAARPAKRGQSRNGAGIDKSAKAAAAIFDPGMIQAASAPPVPLAAPATDVPGTIPIEADEVGSDLTGSSLLDSRPVVEAEAPVTAGVDPNPSAETVVTEEAATPDGAPPTVESWHQTQPPGDDPNDGDGSAADAVADVPAISEEVMRSRRKAVFGGMVQRLKAAVTPIPVVDVPPGTTDGVVDELPPPLAPPILQPLPASSFPDVIATPTRGPHAPAPRALQPQVPGFPSPTRLFPTTTIGIDTVGRTRPSYVDAPDDEPVVIPTIRRPVRSTAPVGRRRPRIRRVTRVIRHVDPWSVFKVAVCFSAVLYGVCLTAGVLLWNVAYTTGTIDNIERFFESFGWDRFEFKGGELYHSAWIAGMFAAVGLTGLIVLAATLFNLITDLVGGIRVTVLEEEVVERDPAKRRPVLRGRRVDLKPVIDPYDPDAPLESIDAMPGSRPGSIVEPVWVEPARDLRR